MNLNSYVRHLKESFFVSEKPLFYRFDEWKKDTHGKLFVVGSMGSEKETYAKKVARAFDCGVIDLDNLLKEYVSKFIMKNPDIDVDKLSNEEASSIHKQIISDMYFDIKKKKERKVIEGIQIIWMPREELLNNNSVVLFRTSELVSIWSVINTRMKGGSSKRIKFSKIIGDILLNTFIKEMKSFRLDLIKRIGEYGHLETY